MYTPSSGIQILCRDAPLNDKWRRSEQRNHKSYVIQSEAKDLECINAFSPLERGQGVCHSERSEESECTNMYTPSSGIQILRRDAPLNDK